MTFRLRIALLVGVSCAVIAVGVGILGHRSTEQRLVDELDRSLSDVSELLVGVRGPGRVPTRVVGDVYSVRIVGSGGVVIGTNFVSEVPVGAAVVADVVDVPLARSFGTWADAAGDRYRVLSIGVDGGAVQIARPLAETENVLADLQRRTVLLVVVTTVVAAALGWFVAGRIAAPLRRLAAAADTVESSGELDVDLGPAGGDDEVGRLRRSFGSMLDALSQSRAEQRRLVQDAGHELRTPLTSLRTNLAVIRRHSDMSPELREEIVADLDAEVDELADLVDELVAAASGEHGDETPIEVDVAALASTVAARVARRRGRRIEVDAPEARLVAVAGPLGLARAMTNVIDNACKFDAGAGPVSVAVSEAGTPAGSIVSFRVSDAGPGVPEADLPRIFDRFHRVEATRTLPGSGLGLAIVRDVVERVGGSVFAANRPGGGAVIGFDLPAAS